MSLLLTEARQTLLAQLREGAGPSLCEGCHLEFIQDKGFERLCPVCFKLDRGYALYASDKMLLFTQEGLRAAKEEHSGCPEQMAKWKRRAVAFRKAAKARLNQKRIRALVMLCHPDRHGNSAEATQITQWLLDMRAEGRS